MAAAVVAAVVVVVVVALAVVVSVVTCTVRGRQSYARYAISLARIVFSPPDFASCLNFDLATVYNS